MINNNQRPVILRLLFAIIAVAVFAVAMHPVFERDFMDVLKSKIRYNTEDVRLVKALAEADTEVALSPDTEKLGMAEAVMNACDLYGINLASYVDSSAKIRTTKDVIALVKAQCASAIRLGIDIKGGVEYLIALVDIPEEEGGAPSNLTAYEKADRARETIRKRLENSGIFESEISIQQGKFVCIRAPLRSAEEKQNLRNMITQAAKLRFHLVAESELNRAEVEKYREALAKNDPHSYVAPDGYEIKRCDERTDRAGNPVVDYYLIKSEPEMNGNDIKSASTQREQNNRIGIRLEFGRRGTLEFGKVTRENVHRMLAIVLDGTLYSAPVLQTEISGGVASITGNFTPDEAQNLANVLQSGNLPFKMVVSGEYDVDNALGTENRDAGMKAGLVAIILVMVFMALYYLKSGWIANIALLCNIVLVLGALSAFQQTLTLPGIAGVILTIGMAVDANVLINERIREELATGKSMFHAIDNGYKRVFWTIFDSNITTLLIGVILMWFATGAVKGFAIVLSVGILTSMFTALFVTRVVFDILAKFDRPKSLPMFAFFGLGTKIVFDFLGLRKKAFIVSLVLILISFGAFFYRGTDALSIDFLGGTQLSFNYQGEKITEHELTQAFETAGITNTRIGFKSTTNQKIIEIIVGAQRGKTVEEGVKYAPQVAGIIEKTKPGFLLPEKDDAGKVIAPYSCDEKTIGGLVGWAFAQTALLSIVMAAIGILIYVALRFEFAFALGATLSLIHDVVIAAGIFVLLGGEISLTVVAALLTLYGYSINDTIVIYDRIREQHQLFPRRSLYEIINDAVNQTLPRTILTSTTVFITVVTLLFLGGPAIRDFSIVMFIGLLIGTYSSVYIANPIVYWWNKSFGIKYDTSSVNEKAPVPQA